MCWFKRKNRQKISMYVQKEIPPEAPISNNAVLRVWSEDKKSFGEVFFANGAYKYSCCKLFYDEDFSGYYWSPISNGFASFFDTLDKAKQAAEDFMQNQ